MHYDYYKNRERELREKVERIDDIFYSLALGFSIACFSLAIGIAIGYIIYLMA